MSKSPFLQVLPFELPAVSQEFLVETIIPTREISLVAGPSGAGKTRWLLNMLKRWEKGDDFLGYHSYPVKWAYAPGDRSQPSVARTLRDLGLTPKDLNIIPSWGSDYKTLPQIVDAALSIKAKLLVIEGFAGYAEDTNGPAIRSFLCSVQRMIEKDDLTFIGVAESPKMKPYERYENPRQRVSGAAAWAHYTETIFLVEPSDISDIKNPSRKLYVCPRNAPSIELQGNFDTKGRLIFTL